MVFKKKTRTAFCVLLLLACVLLCGFAYTGAYAADINGSPVSTQLPPGNNDLEPASVVIECMSEDVTIIQEGSEFKVEMDAESENSYRIRNNTKTPMGERDYRYNKWDLIFERTDSSNTTAEYSSAIIVTIPEDISSLYVTTWSGNILIENLTNINLSVESKEGEIYIADTNTMGTDIHSRSKIQLVNLTSTDDIIINDKSYYGGEYMTDTEGHHTIILDGLSFR